MLHFASNRRHAAGSLEISSFVSTTSSHILSSSARSCTQLRQIIIGKARQRFLMSMDSTV